jgi:hypothetical protein
MSLPIVSIPCANCGAVRPHQLKMLSGEQVMHCPSCFLPFRAILQDGQAIDSLKMAPERDKLG